MELRIVRCRHRLGAAARNVGAAIAAGAWLVMLDDDSYPLDAGVATVVAEAPADVAAIGAEIRLRGPRREDGGLPEVFVGCGAAVRRDAFLAAGGYDRAFHYYAEEYDLCARLILGGWRIVHDRRFRVRHEKVASGRDMNVILRRLVRNNGWVAQRYAPASMRAEALREVFERYARIAHLEEAGFGFQQGVDELMLTLDEQPVRTMRREEWDRFTGLAHVRRVLEREPALSGALVSIVDEGKNAWVVRQTLLDRGDCAVVDPAIATVGVIGTLSPGPMMDAWERRRARDEVVVRPWCPCEESVGGTS
jgi:hypothetical protein